MDNSPAANSFQPKSVIAERYEIVRLIGKGGMGAVFEVHDRALGNDRICLKLFSPALRGDATQISRFRNEVLITRKLSHPNIVRTYDFGETSTGHLYMTMEYVDGASLEQINSGMNAGLSLESAINILCEIARGIGYAHSQGVIHRDLKPGNILINNRNELKIADFGLARGGDIDQHLTRTGDCVGTPAFMSPEQVQGQEVDGRTDIYSLGVIAYELAAGELPFISPSWFELANQIVRSPIPSILSAAPDAPVWYDHFVKRATAKDPEDRFETAEDACLFLENQALRDGLNITASGSHSLPRRISLETSVAQIVGSPEPKRSKLLQQLAAGSVLFLLLALAFASGKSIEKIGTAGRPQTGAGPESRSAPYPVTEGPASQTNPPMKIEEQYLPREQEFPGDRPRNENRYRPDSGDRRADRFTKPQLPPGMAARDLLRRLRQEQEREQKYKNSRR